MDRFTGTPITTVDHIRQSIGDILTTPVGTRVMRRDYGSHVFDLVDAPGNPAGALRVVAAAADAIERWEPRVELRRGSLRTDANGKAVLNLDLITTATASPIIAEIPMGRR